MTRFETYVDKEGCVRPIMASTSNMLLKNEAFDSMIKGMKVATQAIRLSYGPKGLNAVIEEDLPPFHRVANDCETIIQAIHVEDKYEKIGLDLLKELSSKANKDSADGRKTTLIIAETILDECYKQGLSGLQLKKELDELIPIIEEEIKKQTKQITVEEVGAVATIAGESESIGKLLAEIYKRIGANGVIIPEGSGTFETSYNIIEGVRFVDTGFLSPFMVRDETAAKEGRKETKAIYENPTILVTKRKINHLNDINPLLEALTKQGKKDLVIFTDDMDSGVASILVKAHKDKVLNILIIKAPTFWKQYVFEDFAKVTGSTIVEDNSGITFKNLKLEHLGTCGKITVDKEETVIIPSVDFSEHVDNLKQIGDNDSKLRLSWLQTKTCILKLGANNESELSWIRLKCNDAINSSVLALKEGVVQGGGGCLEMVAESMPNTIVGKILKTALTAPVVQLAENSGVCLEEYGVGDEVVDASIVVKNACRNAIALASTVLTTGIVIVKPPKKEETLKDKQMTWN